MTRALVALALAGCPKAAPVDTTGPEGSYTARTVLEVTERDGAFDVAILNVDDRAHRWWFGGGGTTCDDFAWDVALIGSGDRSYFPFDRAMAFCGDALSPARWIEIPAGEAVRLAVDPTAPIWLPDRPIGGTFGERDGRAVPPGRYTLLVTGAGLRHTHELTIP